MIEKQRTFSRKGETGRKKLSCESIVLTEEMGAPSFWTRLPHSTKTKSRSKEDRWASKSKDRENTFDRREATFQNRSCAIPRFLNHSTDRVR